MSGWANSVSSKNGMCLGVVQQKGPLILFLCLASKMGARTDKESWVVPSCCSNVWSVTAANDDCNSALCLHNAWAKGLCVAASRQASALMSFAIARKSSIDSCGTCKYITFDFASPSWQSPGRPSLLTLKHLGGGAGLATAVTFSEGGVFLAASRCRQLAAAPLGFIGLFLFRSGLKRC